MWFFIWWLCLLIYLISSISCYATTLLHFSQIMIGTLDCSACRSHRSKELSLQENTGVCLAVICLAAVAAVAAALLFAGFIGF
jgi:hypothetical protein